MSERFWQECHGEIMPASIMSLYNFKTSIYSICKVHTCMIRDLGKCESEHWLVFSLLISSFLLLFSLRLENLCILHCLPISHMIISHRYPVCDMCSHWVKVFLAASILKWNYSGCHVHHFLHVSPEFIRLYFVFLGTFGSPVELKIKYYGLHSASL